MDKTTPGTPTVIVEVDTAPIEIGLIHRIALSIRPAFLEFFERYAGYYERGDLESRGNIDRFLKEKFGVEFGGRGDILIAKKAIYHDCLVFLLTLERDKMIALLAENLDPEIFTIKDFDPDLVKTVLKEESSKTGKELERQVEELASQT